MLLLLLFYLFIYFLKNPSLNNSSKFRFSNLIPNFQNSNSHIYLFNHYYFCYYYYSIYLFIFKIPSLNNSSKFQFLSNLIPKIPIFKSNFQNANFQIILELSIFLNNFDFTLVFKYFFNSTTLHLSLRFRNTKNPVFSKLVALFS